MSDHDPLTVYRRALDGAAKRRGLGVRLIGAASVVALVGAAVAGLMFFTGSDRASRASPSGARDPFLCEQALDQRDKAEADAIEAGGPPLRKPGEPRLLYVCFPGPGAIVKLDGDSRNRQQILANAIYALDLDGRTRVVGLAVPGARYGWNGRICSAVKGAGAVRLTDPPPVDPASCLGGR